jgi:quercetin dioxygenase-like cupin family protein
VKRFRFGEDAAFAPREDLLDGVTIAPLTRSLSDDAPVQAAVFRIAAGGGIKRHEASVPQVLAVLEGSGLASGSDGIGEPIATGDAVYWAAGEEHETTTATGLTALVLEGLGLQPFG